MSPAPSSRVMRRTFTSRVINKGANDTQCNPVLESPCSRQLPQVVGTGSSTFSLPMGDGGRPSYMTTHLQQPPSCSPSMSRFSLGF